MKDYPIEENPELTIKSVLNNLMLYQEGWGVESIKHSLTYSGGLSRGYMMIFRFSRNSVNLHLITGKRARIWPGIDVHTSSVC